MKSKTNVSKLVTIPFSSGDIKSNVSPLIYIPNDEYTKLLLHFNGVDGATATVDSSSSAHSITFNGNAQLDTAIKKFSTASLLLDGNSDYVYALDSADWDFGSSDFTIDGWFKRDETGTGAHVVVARWDYATGNYQCFVLQIQNNVVQAVFSDDGSSTTLNLVGSTSVANTDWHHIAVARDGNTIRLFLDGTIETSGTFSTAIFNNNRTLFIGTSNGGVQNFFSGNLDEIQISNGIALWTSNFTPPTQEYS